MWGSMCKSVGCCNLLVSACFPLPSAGARAASAAGDALTLTMLLALYAAVADVLLLLRWRLFDGGRSSTAGS